MPKGQESSGFNRSCILVLKNRARRFAPGIFMVSVERSGCFVILVHLSDLCGHVFDADPPPPSFFHGFLRRVVVFKLGPPVLHGWADHAVDEAQRHTIFLSGLSEAFVADVHFQVVAAVLVEDARAVVAGGSAYYGIDRVIVF